MRVAQEKAREEAMQREIERERQRRPSRFQVVPAPDVLFVRQMSEHLENVDKVGNMDKLCFFIELFHCTALKTTNH